MSKYLSSLSSYNSRLLAHNLTEILLFERLSIRNREISVLISVLRRGMILMKGIIWECWSRKEHLFAFLFWWLILTRITLTVIMFITLKRSLLRKLRRFYGYINIRSAAQNIHLRSRQYKMKVKFHCYASHITYEIVIGYCPQSVMSRLSFNKKLASNFQDKVYKNSLQSVSTSTLF